MNKSVPSTSAIDVYRWVTEKIVKAVEAGAAEFRMPWHRAGSAAWPVNASTGKSYRGVNVVSLWAATTLQGYASGRWATYKQWQSLGAQVRRGEKGSIIVFYKELLPAEDTQGPEEAYSTPRFVARPSWVFNASQVDGYQPPEPERRDLVQTLESVEAFVAATKAEVRHLGEKACYHVVDDFIEMPRRSLFLGTETSSPTESYYAVLLHELTHWTGAVNRLARDFKNRFGSEAYAMEELVAELGAAFLCAALGIANEPRADHAAYVASWLKAFDRDSKALFTAANRASAAADYLTDLASNQRDH